jgi:hypothetical protein
MGGDLLQSKTKMSMHPTKYLVVHLKFLNEQSPSFNIFFIQNASIVAGMNAAVKSGSTGGRRNLFGDLIIVDRNFSDARERIAR